MANQFGYQGTQEPTDDKSEFNAISYVIAQALARLSISNIVKVVAVDDPGSDSLTGTVDIQIMTNQLDGALNAVPHATAYGVPYWRLQGGANAIIITPQIGDLGVAVFADRDISAVKAQRGQANPGSLRRFDIADAMYLGGILNGIPARYVKIDDSGVTIEGVANVTIHGENTTVNATSTTVNTETLDVVATGDVTVTASGQNVTVTATTTTVNGDVQINGTLTVA